MPQITQIPDNTPLNLVPQDYFPEGYGFWFELSKGIDKGKKLFFRDSIHGEGTPNNTIIIFNYTNSS